MILAESENTVALVFAIESPHIIELGVLSDKLIAGEVTLVIIHLFYK